MIIPSILTATVYKDTIDSEVGLSFCKVNKGGGIVISEIHYWSPFRNTALCQGDLVLAVNGQQHFEQVRDIAVLIQQASKQVTIIATSRDSPPIPKGCELAFANHRINPFDVGIRFGLTRNILVQVIGIDKQGPFANSSIQVGDVCVLVEGIPVCDVQRARTLLKQSSKQSCHNAWMLVFKGHSFRTNVLARLKQERQDKLWNVEWPCSNECIVNVKEPASNNNTNPKRRFSNNTTTSTPYNVTLKFENDYTLVVKDRFSHLQDVKDHPHRIAKYFLPLMRDLDTVHKSYIEPKMKSLVVALQRANDCMLDAGFSDHFMVQVQELLEYQRQGYLTENEVRAAKSKLMGIAPPQNESSSTWAIAVPEPKSNQNHA